MRRIDIPSSVRLKFLTAELDSSAGRMEFACYPGIARAANPGNDFGLISEAATQP